MKYKELLEQLEELSPEQLGFHALIGLWLDAVIR